MGEGRVSSGGTRAPARRTFAQRARAAIQKHIGEARTPAAHWTTAINLAWVRWAREDGTHFYLALRRHLDWVTGEAAIARAPLPLEDLPLLAADDAVPAGAPGYRIRLGALLHDEDRWWPAGASPAEEQEQLEWLALQLRTSAESHFRRRPIPRR
jgi:hypothetical protein